MKSEKRKALEKSERIPDGRKSVPPLVVFSRACATLFLSARSRSAAGRFIAVGKRERRSPWRPSYLDVERVALSELLLVTRVLEPHAPPTRPDQAGLWRVRTGTLHAQIGMKICLGGGNQMSVSFSASGHAASGPSIACRFSVSSFGKSEATVTFIQESNVNVVTLLFQTLRPNICFECIVKVDRRAYHGAKTIETAGCDRRAERL